MFKFKKGKTAWGPVITIIVLIGIVVLLSFFFGKIELDAQKTQVIKGNLETTVVNVKNIFSREGITYMLSNTVSNFQLFEPLVLLIIALIAYGIGEASGLFKAIFTPLKKLSSRTTIFLTLLVGIICSFIGIYSYILLIPLVGIIYSYIGKKPMLGIMTIFIGITIGGASGLFYSYNDYLLGTFTQAAANVSIDKAYTFSLTSVIYIMIFSMLALSFIGMLIIDKYLAPKINKSEIEEKDLVISKKGLIYSGITFAVLLAIIIYMIVPGTFGSGFLLGTGDSYIVRLFGESSPFNASFMCIILLIIMICSFVYGYTSKNIKNSTEYSIGLSDSFKGLGYVFVLMFFTSILISAFEWSNIGEVISLKLVDLLSALSFSGIPLIICAIIIMVIISILIPNLITKWALISPIIVPIFMQANFTPDFTQYIFKVCDGIGKCFTPLFVYFIIMLAFLQKYNSKANLSITIFGTIKKMMPTILMCAGIMVLIILMWYIVGLPLGVGTFTTL